MSDESSVSSRAPSPIDAVSPGVRTARPYRFTWDPSRRGPASVSGTTEGGADYFAKPPRLDGLNASSLSLALGALPSEWSSSKHGFHAISTMLNNPHKRQAPPKAHSALPAVLPADLPRVRRKDFDSYLRAISPEWDRYEKNGELAKDDQPSQLDGPSTPRASLSSQSAMTPRTLRHVQGKSMPPLNSVPSIFFEPVFNLGDPRTFNTVTETGDGYDDNSDPSSLSHSLPLLEKFSHYADTVEQHLVREISLRSTSFFAALTNLHELQSESEQCLDRISKLRGLLKDVDENAAKRGLQMVRKESRMRNLHGLREGIKMVSSVVEITSVARGLVAAGQWGEALGVIEEIENLWKAEPISVSTPTPTTTRSFLSSPSRNSVRSSLLPPMPETSVLETKSTRPPPVSLSSLHAFASLPSSLQAMTMEITSALSSELVNVLRVDLVDRMASESVPPTLAQMDADLALKDRLRPLLQGLSRTKGVRNATLTWREVVIGEVRAVTKRHLPPSQSEDDVDIPNSEQPDGLANHLRCLAHSDFVKLLRAIYKSFLNGIEGLQTQSGIIVDILEAVQTPNVSLAASAVQEELSDILSSAAELSNTRAAKVVGIRSEQHAVLDLPNFLSFFNESWNFVLKCEIICRRMIVGLRGVVVSQAKFFLQSFHQTRISISAKLVEDEQWNPSEVSPFLQHVTNLIIDSAIRDSTELTLNSEILSSSTPPPSPSPANGTSPSTALSSQLTAPPVSKSNGSSTGSKHLRIEDRTYFAVSATAEVLVLLLDYLRVIVNLSTLTTDTMSRVIEYLKAFNSRTCQVVLGAGAMRSAGLKNITAKHLALASQSLSIMIALIPYVRETFRRHLNTKQAVMLVEFDKLKRDYQEHQNEIHAKLIAIMGDRLSAHIKALQMINWETPKQGVNDYMELLVKETVTLHKVLSRYLPIQVVEYVMTQVFAAINHRLSEEYGKIELPDQEAKSRLLTDAKYLHHKLSALKNVGTPSNMLETVIAEKGIGPKQPPPPPGTPTHPTANQRIKGIFVKSPTVDKALPTTTALLAPVTTPTTGTNGSTREGGAGRQNNASRVMSPPPSAALPSYIPAKAVATSETDLSPNPAAVRQEPVVANTVEQSAALVRDHESAGIPSAGFGFMASPLPQLPPPPPPTPSTAARTGAELGYTDPFA